MTKNILDEYPEYLEERCHVAYARTFVPFYLASIGSHLLNLHNRATKIYSQSRMLPNLRNHIAFVAPPGFFKSFLLEILLDEDLGLLGNADDPSSGSIVKGTFQATMTSAAFIGGAADKVDKDMGYEYKAGIAETRKDEILGFEEFDAVTSQMQNTNGYGVKDNDLLTALDSGRVRKALSGVEISYTTNVTVWCATQPARMNMSSGLARRFTFLKFFPTIDQIYEIRRQRRLGRGLKPDLGKINKFREMLGEQFEDRILSIREITGLEKLDEINDEMDCMHTEEIINEKLAIGYSVLMKKDDDPTLPVVIDDRIVRMMKLQNQWRDDLAGDPLCDMVVKLLLRDGEMDLYGRLGLYWWLHKLGMDDPTINEVVWSAGRNTLWKIDSTDRGKRKIKLLRDVERVKKLEAEVL